LDTDPYRLTNYDYRLVDLNLKDFKGKFVDDPLPTDDTKATPTASDASTLLSGALSFLAANLPWLM
jgi:hypothetical protein